MNHQEQIEEVKRLIVVNQQNIVSLQKQLKELEKPTYYDMGGIRICNRIRETPNTQYPLGIAIKHNLMVGESWCCSEDSVLSLLTKKQTIELVEKLNIILGEI